MPVGAVAWYDNDIRFDLLTRYLKPCAGERVYEVIEPVEDTKGNNGEPGKLIVTNLRLLWQSLKYPKINLSIGYNPITSINIKSVSSKLRGLTDSLHILAKTRTSRYEFIFTNLVLDHNRLFPVVIGVQRAYTASRLYREIKMRSGTTVINKRLAMLPQEQIVEQVAGVWNLSSDQGNLGSFFVTNIRVVWWAATNELFNASIPFLQIGSIKVRDSKFGKALVIETCETGGSYVLGFRIDPKERLVGVFKLLLSIQEAFVQNPVYGVEWRSESLLLLHGPTNEGDEVGEYGKKKPKPATTVEEVEEIESNPELASDAFAAYYASAAHGLGNKEFEIVFSAELGLAIEKPKEGFSLQSLWEVVGGGV